MAASRLALYKGITVLDGSFSSPLEAEGVQIQGDPLWTARALITDHAKVLEVHKKYLAAGAKIIETNSYQAAIPNLRKELGDHGQGKAEELVRSSVQLARKAIVDFCQQSRQRPDDFLVAGSVGPYAVVLHDGSEYSGQYVHTTPHEDILAYYQGQADSLVDAGVDLLAFETVPSLAEAKLIVEVLRSLPNPVFSWISFTCRDDTYTCGGDRFADVVSALCLVPFVNMIGINCTAPQHVTSLLKQGTHGMKPFVVYPNSGEQWEHDSGWHSASDQVSLAQYVPEWATRGVKVIGGCCRVGPSEIKQIAEAVANLSNPVDLTNLNLER